MRLGVFMDSQANRLQPCTHEFLAIVSHELRTPLASIHSAASCLANPSSEISSRQKMHAVVERQVRRMTRLIDDLLDVSRIASGCLHLRRERVDLRTVVEHSIETLEGDFNARHQPLSCVLPVDPVWLQADPLRLEQVFINLLANASRYTDSGGAISISVHTGDSDALVRVQDAGIGIAADALPHIFDLFRQAHETDPRSRGGLGIGLAVVRNLVQLHQGSVTAISGGVGKGTEFTVRLPRED
jgi:signal transduction histidine kinase